MQTTTHFLTKVPHSYIPGTPSAVELIKARQRNRKQKKMSALLKSKFKPAAISWQKQEVPEQQQHQHQQEGIDERIVECVSMERPPLQPNQVERCIELIARRALETRQLSMLSRLTGCSERARNVTVRVFSEALRPGTMVRCTGLGNLINVESRMWSPPPPLDGGSYESESGFCNGDTLRDYWVCWVAPCWPDIRTDPVLNWRVWLIDANRCRVFVVKTRALIPRSPGSRGLQIVSIRHNPANLAARRNSTPSSRLNHPSSPTPIVSVNVTTVLPLDSPVMPPEDSRWRAEEGTLWRTEQMDEFGGLYLTPALVDPDQQQQEQERDLSLYIPAHMRKFCMGMKFPDVEEAPPAGGWAAVHLRYTQTMWRVVMQPGWLCDNTSKLAVLTGCSMSTDPEVRGDIATWMADGWSQSNLRRTALGNHLPTTKVGHSVLHELVCHMPPNGMLACDIPARKTSSGAKTTATKELCMELTDCAQVAVTHDSFSRAMMVVDNMHESGFAARWILAAQGHSDSSIMDIECHAPTVLPDAPYISLPPHHQPSSDPDTTTTITAPTGGRVEDSMSPSRARYAIHTEQPHYGPYSLFMVDSYYRQWKVCKLRLLTQLDCIEHVYQNRKFDSETELLSEHIGMWHPGHQGELSPGVSSNISFAIPGPSASAQPPFFWFATFEELKRWLVRAYVDVIETLDTMCPPANQGPYDSDHTEEYFDDEDDDDFSYETQDNAENEWDRERHI